MLNKMNRVAFTLFILCFSHMASALVSENCHSTLMDERDEFRGQICLLINEIRMDAKLSLIHLEDNLSLSAQKHASDMQINDYFSHTSRNGSSPFDRMRLEGIHFQSAAENIAQGQRTAESVVKAWMNSPGHRKNILGKDYKKMGIGLMLSQFYWVQNFTD